MTDDPPRYPGPDPASGWPPAPPQSYPPGPPVDPFPDARLPGEPYPGATYPVTPYPTTPYPYPTTPYPTVPLAPPAYPASPPYGPPILQPATVTVVLTPPSSGAATSSMVLGIIGLVFACFSCGIPSLLAIIFGHVGLNQTRNNVMSGRGFAIAGMVMGYVLIIPALIATAYLVSYYGHVGPHVGPAAPSPPRY